MENGNIIVPKKRALYRYAVDTFVKMLSKVQERYREYRCNNNDVMCWNAFVDAYSDIILTEGFIHKFCEYGIQSWFNRDERLTQLQKHTCRFSWIFSRKAIDRWNVYGLKGNEKFIQTELKQIYDFDLGGVKPHLRSAFINVRPVEERFKQETKNGRRTLAWCVANTTLFNHRSPLCVACSYKVECKDILKMNYPKIFKLRGYK